MDLAVEWIFDALSTALSSGTASSGGLVWNTAEFGIRDGRTFDDDGPSGALQRNRMVAALATTSSAMVERGRSRRPERSSRSIRITTTHVAATKSKSTSRPPKTTVSPRGNKELTADELLDSAIADAKKKAGRVKTPELNEPERPLRTGHSYWHPLTH